MQLSIYLPWVIMGCLTDLFSVADDLVHVPVVMDTQDRSAHDATVGGDTTARMFPDPLGCLKMKVSQQFTGVMKSFM